MDPDPKPYNLFYFRGSNNFNIGVDYMLKSNRIKFYGETALSKNGAISTLNALQLTPVYISFLVLYAITIAVIKLCLNAFARLYGSE